MARIWPSLIEAWLTLPPNSLDQICSFYLGLNPTFLSKSPKTLTELEWARHITVLSWTTLAGTVKRSEFGFGPSFFLNGKGVRPCFIHCSTSSRLPLEHLPISYAFVLHFNRSLTNDLWRKLPGRKLSSLLLIRSLNVDDCKRVWKKSTQFFLMGFFLVNTEEDFLTFMLAGIQPFIDRMPLRSHQNWTNSHLFSFGRIILLYWHCIWCKYPLVRRTGKQGVCVCVGFLHELPAFHI